MTNFSFIGHVYKYERVYYRETVYVKNQNGTLSVDFEPDYGVDDVLAGYHNCRDMTSYLVSIEGEIHGEWDSPRFVGKTIRVI